MEAKRYRRRSYRPGSRMVASQEPPEAGTSAPKPISRLSLLIAVLGTVITATVIILLYIAARNAMGGPGLDLPPEELYVRRCGACHEVPPAEQFARWGPRDWDRMLPLTMFMPGEQDKVHHYLDRVSGKGAGAPTRPGLPGSP